MKELVEKIKNSDCGPLGKGLLYMMVLAFAFVIDMAIALPVMWLWNWLMPMLFALPALTYWQTFGLMLLCGFLFKSKLD